MPIRPFAQKRKVTVAFCVAIEAVVAEVVADPVDAQLPVLGARRDVVAFGTVVSRAD